MEREGNATSDGYQYVLGYLLPDRSLFSLGRSITLAQTVIEHGSATVGFNQYLPVLEAAQALLPEGSPPTLLADRGFEHGELMRWLTKQQWDWAIRVKSDLLITLGNGRQQSIHELFALPDQAILRTPLEKKNGRAGQKKQFIA